MAAVGWEQGPGEDGWAQEPGFGEAAGCRPPFPG